MIDENLFIIESFKNKNEKWLSTLFSVSTLFKEKTVEPFLGEIKICAFPFAPKGWAFCNGALMSVQQNNALFALLGVQYGGDGKNTFALPDLRGRVACTGMAIPYTRSNRWSGNGCSAGRTFTAAQSWRGGGQFACNFSACR
jgi:hypothetical protein